MEAYLSEEHIEMNENSLDFWKTVALKLPIKSYLEKKPLAISDHVERFFSVAGKILRPDRCRMSDSTFEKLIMIKCNGNIL